jgi:hypothetical protein
MRLKTFTAALLLTGLMAAGAAHAQGNPILDLAGRVQFSANGSYMWFSPLGEATDNWRGADLGGAATLSLHQRLAVYAIGESRGHFNILRAMANLKIYPAHGSESDNTVFIGAGRGWFGTESVRELRSTEVQVVASHLFNDHLAGFGMYTHSFADAPATDFDFLKVGFNVHP